MEEVIRHYWYYALKKLLVIVLTIQTGNSVYAQQVSSMDNGISNYRVYYGITSFEGTDMAVIREFEKSGKFFYVIINPYNLTTGVVPAWQIRVQPSALQTIMNKFRGSAYIKALQRAARQSYPLQDAGIIHGYPKEHGITLTVDLCPSHKPLDRIIFTSLIAEFGKIEKPVPVALSVTGKFFESHHEDFEWIRNLISSGEIEVTWVNHTWNHHYDPHKSLRNNFLLEPGTDMNQEILKTEIALLQEGFLFSVFFRFPGLVSDHRIVEKVLDYGLIPVGSDAWLAKGQQPYHGSIVLIHGNGNEPLGVYDFLTLLQKNRQSVLKKQWLLYDLRESVEHEFR